MTSKSSKGAPPPGGGRRTRKREDDNTRPLQQGQPAARAAPKKTGPAPAPPFVPPPRDATQELEMDDVEVLADESVLKGEPTRPTASVPPPQPAPVVAPPQPAASTLSPQPVAAHEDDFDPSVFPPNPVTRLLRKLRRRS